MTHYDQSRPSPTSTWIAVTGAALIAFGIVMVFSATASLSSPGLSEDPLHNPSLRQALFSVLALAALLISAVCPYSGWRIRPRSFFQPAVFLMLITLALLAAVLVPGVGEVRNGARRWLALGPAAFGFGFQPSEVAKLSLVVFLAAFAAWRSAAIQRFWTGFLPATILAGAVVGLVGVEDLGTAALLALVSGCLLWGAGARIWHLCLAMTPAVGGLIYLLAAKPYRIQRLTAFLNPEADPQGAGYHQLQSLLTIASGSWWGRGLGAGIQKYGYLPEGRTDFIFAVICEELGILGGIAVIALFAVMVWQGKRAMNAAPDELGRLLALGATLTIGLQAAMNIAVVTVSIPTKGIGLPLVSAGGTGVVFFSILVGILVNVARWRDHEQIEALSCEPSHTELRNKSISALALQS